MNRYCLIIKTDAPDKPMRLTNLSDQMALSIALISFKKFMKKLSEPPLNKSMSASTTQLNLMIPPIVCSPFSKILGKCISL